MKILNKTHLVKVLAYFPEVQEKINKTTIAGAAFVTTNLSKVLKAVVVLNGLDPARSQRDRLFESMSLCFATVHDGDYDKNYNPNFWSNKKFQEAKVVNQELTAKQFVSATDLSDLTDPPALPVSEEVSEQLLLFTDAVDVIEQSELKVAIGVNAGTLVEDKLMRNLEELIKTTDDPHFKDQLNRQYTHQENGLNAPTRNFAEIARVRRTSLA